MNFGVTQGFGTDEIVAATLGADVVPVPVVVEVPTYNRGGGGGGIPRWRPPPIVRLKEHRQPKPPAKPVEMPRRYIPWPKIEPAVEIPPADLRPAEPLTPLPKHEPTPPADVARAVDSIKNPWLKAAVTVDQAKDIVDVLPALRDIAVTAAGQKLARKIATDLVNDVLRNPKDKRKRERPSKKDKKR